MRLDQVAMRTAYDDDVRARPECGESGAPDQRHAVDRRDKFRRSETARLPSCEHNDADISGIHGWMGLPELPRLPPARALSTASISALTASAISSGVSEPMS